MRFFVRSWPHLSRVTVHLHISSDSSNGHFTGLGYHYLFVQLQVYWCLSCCVTNKSGATNASSIKLSNLCFVGDGVLRWPSCANVPSFSLDFSESHAWHLFELTYPTWAVLLILPLVVECMHCYTIGCCRHSWIGLLHQCPFILVGFQEFSHRHMSSTVSLRIPGSLVLLSLALQRSICSTDMT